MASVTHSWDPHGASIRWVDKDAAPPASAGDEITLRIMALRHSIDAYKEYGTAEDIVEHAETFLAFLKGEPEGDK